ncbi:MAG: phage portal protein [Sutterella wadsworthensis]|nr:phage portal protein [Sutterella wadsworthensis]
MNLLDKAIRAISPERALKRFEARRKLEILNSGYSRHGGSYAKKSLIGWLSGGSDADADIVDNLETLRNRSRDLYMGSPLATGALKTVRTNVVGSGLALNAQVDAKFLGLTEEQAKEWEENTEREWRLWSESVNCDAERRQTFFQLQSLVLLSALMSGDVFVTMPIIPRKGCAYDLRIGLIEADRVCDPLNASTTANILGGIEVGTYGETVAYWVAKHHPGAIPRIGQDLQQEWKRVLAFGTTTGRRNVLHIMADVERPAQRRGVPMLAPVIEALKQLSRYSEAELMAAVVSGMFTVFVKSNTPDSPLATAFNPAMQVDKDPSAYEMGNGSIVALDEGEEVQIADPSRPNPNFDPFVIAICRQIGAALEIPYELLVKNFTASYSASRASLLEAWKMFRMRREWLVGNFCQPIYEEWLTEAVLKGRVQAPGFFDDPAIRAAWCGAEWFGDAQGQLDPLKEANAAKVRVDEGFSTREREAAELTGMKYDQVHAVRKREEAMRREDGLSATASAQPITEPEKEETDE